MGIVVNTNIPSIAASRHLYETRADLQVAMERLASGKRINGAADDAAGMSVVSRMKAQISGLNQAVRNANDGISLVNTYDGAATEITDILVRMRELATLAQNGTYSSADRTNANQEYTALIAEITRIATKTTWNGTVDLTGNSANTFSFQVGFGAGEAIAFAARRLEATTAGIFASGAVAPSDILNIASSITEVAKIDDAIAQLNSGRAAAGAVANRLAHTVSNLMNVSQRTEEARSRIEDADFADESASLARANVLSQAGTAMLAQANQQPQYILSLLRS